MSLFAAGLGLTPRPVVPGEEAYLASHFLHASPLGPELWDPQRGGPGLGGLTRLWTAGPNTCFVWSGDGPGGGGSSKGDGPTDEELRVVRGVVKLYATYNSLRKAALDSIREVAQSALESDKPFYRPEALAEVARGVAEVGMAEEAHTLIRKAAEQAAAIDDLEGRASAWAEVAQKMAAIGMAEEAHTLIRKAAEQAAAIDDLGERASARAEVAQKMAAIGMAEEARALIREAAQSALEIDEEDDDDWALRRKKLSDIVRGMAAIAVALKDRTLLAEAAEQANWIDVRFYRCPVEAEVARGMAELGMTKRARRLIREAAESALGIYNDDMVLAVQAQAKIAREMAAIGMAEEARAHIHEAAQFVAEIDEEDDNERDRVQAHVAFDMAFVALALRDRTLFAEADSLLREIKYEDNHRVALYYVVDAKAAFAVAIHDITLLVDAAEQAAAIDDLEGRVSAWVKVAQKMAAIGMAEEAHTLIRKAAEQVVAIDDLERRASAWAEIAQKMATIGMAEEAHTLIRKAAEQAAAIDDLEGRASAWAEVSRGTVKLASLSQRQADTLAAPLGGVTGERFRAGVQELLRSLPTNPLRPFVRQLATIPEASDLLEGLPVPLQDQALLGRAVGTPLSESDRKPLRRTAHRNLSTSLQTGNSHRFRVMTTTLSHFEDDPATQALLELARNWTDYSDPRFPQLLSRLIETKSPKAFDLATRILGEATFQKRKRPERPWLYRLWLLRKLEQKGYIEKGLNHYLEEKIRSGMDPKIIDQWIQGVVRELGWIPNLFVMFLMDREWVTQGGRKLTGPSAVIAYIKLGKKEFEKTFEELFLLPKKWN
jgi:hypothetical protein